MEETQGGVENAGLGSPWPSASMKGRRRVSLDRLLEVNKELWVVLTIFLFALIVNLLVSSQRMVLTFYALPTIFSAYYFGRRHATMTAVFTIILVFLLVGFNPLIFSLASTTVYEKWLDLTVWGGFLILTAYAMGTLYEAQKTYIRELRETYRGVLVILRHFISRDKYTENHCYRVSVYASKIAARLGLDTERIEDVRDAALLHDIGKLEISREILYKAARLSQEEFKEVRTHVQKGIEIMSPVGGSLRRILPIIVAHHERFDGSGYHPTEGEEIPLEARIIALADVYDALTSDRPYRKGISPIEAKETIVKRAGTDFDPRVVEAFQTVFNRGEMEVPDILL